MIKPGVRCFALACAIGSLLSCDRQAAPVGSRLVFGVENDLTTLDPIKSQDPYTLRVIGQIYEGLVTLNANDEIVGALAESWSHNATFDVWTFKLRPGVRFQSDSSFGALGSRTVTATDVVDSFKRIVSKESYPAFVLADALVGVAEYQAGTASGVAGLRVVDSVTVEMRLQVSEPSFLHRLTSPWFVIFPREAVALGSDVFGRTKAVGTGPYRLLSRADNEVVLAKNMEYRTKLPDAYDTLVFRVVKNDQIRLTELRNGQIQAMVVTPLLIPAIVGIRDSAGGSQPTKAFRANFMLSSHPTFNSHFIGMNSERMDVHLRRAISLGINRLDALEVVANGAGRVSNGTVPIGLLGYEPPYSADIYDTMAARRELLESKYRTGRDSIELLVHEKASSEQLGQLVQAQLARVGIRVYLTKLEYNAVVGRMIKGETQAFALSLEYVFSAPEPILNNIFNSAKIPVPNFWRYRNASVDSLFAQLRRTGDRAAANRLASQAEKLIIDDAPVAFLYQLDNIAVSRIEVGAIPFNGHSIPLLWLLKHSTP